MAESGGQEKTEQASSKKLNDSRERGQVAKSVEINSLAVFTTGLLLIFMTQSYFSKNIGKLSKDIFGHLDKLELSTDLIQDYAIKGVMFYVAVLGPIFGGLILISLIASYAQIGFRFTPKVFKPTLSRFNPLSGIKNLFFSSRSFVELSKSLFKLFVIGLFTYNVLKGLIIDGLNLMNFSISDIVDFMIESAYSLLWKISLVYAILAAADFAWQKFKHKKDMMMTKQEVKEENRQAEGDPQIKSRIRRAQITSARSRMMKELPKADVVITNPTHYAIALKYKVGIDNAPKVIAKGVDSLAQKIKKVAAEHNIPLHEDRELARALYRHCEVGDEIPANLFKAVAQILAYIFKLKKSKKKSIV